MDSHSLNAGEIFASWNSKPATSFTVVMHIGFVMSKWASWPSWNSTGSTSFRMCCRRIERTYASAKLPIPHLLGDLRAGIQPGGGQLSVVRDAELVHLNLRNLGDSLQQRGQILRKIGRVGL